MLDRRPSLAERLHVQRWNKTITDMLSGTVYQALSQRRPEGARPDPGDGRRGRARAMASPELYDNLVTGTGGRRGAAHGGDQHAVRRPEPRDDGAGRLRPEGATACHRGSDLCRRRSTRRRPMPIGWTRTSGARATLRSMRLPVHRGDAGCRRSGAADASPGAGIPVPLSQPGGRHASNRFLRSTNGWRARATSSRMRSAGDPAMAAWICGRPGSDRVVLYFPEDGGAVLAWFSAPEIASRTARSATRRPTSPGTLKACSRRPPAARSTATPSPGAWGDRGDL